MTSRQTARSASGRPFVACAIVAAGILAARHADARRTGIVTTDCAACHGNARATVDIAASPVGFGPGDDVTVTVTVRREDGVAAVGGTFVVAPVLGELHALPGEGLTLVPDTGLTHAQPQKAVDGAATFRFGWRAPAEPGGVLFQALAVAGNGDGRSSGDATGGGRLAVAFGCVGVTQYADLDRDGYGNEAWGVSIGCEGAAPPPGYATAGGDCNENDAAFHPGATEKCNLKDDDCDGEIDEDSEPVELWPDADGDGHYATRTGTPVSGCVGLAGYAAEGGDCAPADPAVHPGIAELCNGLDDNCDGRPDEFVIPQCGIGTCRRDSSSCDPADCRPGEPEAERCNYRDDDCNGEVDDGDLCGPGSACLAGTCIVIDEGGPLAAGGAFGAGGAEAAAAGTAGAHAAGGTGTGGTSASGGSAGSSEPWAAGRDGTVPTAGAGSFPPLARPAEPVPPGGCSVPARTTRPREDAAFGFFLMALVGSRRLVTARRHGQRSKPGPERSSRP